MNDKLKTKTELIKELESLRKSIVDGTPNEQNEMEEALYDSEERYGMLIEQAPLSIQILDVSGKTIHVNKAWEDLWGISWEEFSKMDYNILEDEQLKRLGVIPYLERAFAGEVVSIPAAEYDAKNTLGKGEKRWVTVVIYPLRDKSGNIHNVTLIHQDITELKLAEKALLKIEKQLHQSQKMETIGQLTGGVAHDFNNILGIVSGNLEMLQIMLPTDSKEYQYVKNAIKGATRGASITRKLLNFSSTDANNVIPTNINDFIVNNLDLIKKSITPSIQIETILSNDLWITGVDQGDFEDALLNISLNAHDAMPDGGTLTITTSNQVLHNLNSTNVLLSNSTDNKSDFVMISFTDNGVGMSKEIRDKVLEPFFTTKDKSKGTGLGLSMVHGFVNRSGGRIEINSIIDEGSTFTLFLPRITEEVILNTSLSIDIECSKGHEVILVVDDEEALREISKISLTELGYTVLTASCANEALEIIETGIKVDLLFSDVVMPGTLDGFKLAIAVHKIQPDLKVLLTSGYIAKRDEILSEENEYLSKLLAKPYSLEELSVAIKHTLNTD